MLFLDFSLKNEHNWQMPNIFKKTDKFLVFLRCQYGIHIDKLICCIPIFYNGIFYNELKWHHATTSLFICQWSSIMRVATTSSTATTPPITTVSLISTIIVSNLVGIGIFFITIFVIITTTFILTTIISISTAFFIIHTTVFIIAIISISSILSSIIVTSSSTITPSIITLIISTSMEVPIIAFIIRFLFGFIFFFLSILWLNEKGIRLQISIICKDEYRRSGKTKSCSELRGEFKAQSNI